MLSAEDRAALLERGEELARELAFGELRDLLIPHKRDLVAEEPQLGYLLALAWYKTEFYRPSLLLVDQLLQVCRRRERDRLLRRCINLRGALHLEHGHLVQAERLFEQVLEEATEADDRQHITNALINIGAVQMVRCRWDEVLILANRALSTAVGGNFVELIASCHHNLGLSYRELRIPGQATDHFEQAAFYYHKLLSRDEIIATDYEGALVTLLTGDLEIGLRKAQSAFYRAHGLGSPRTIAEAARVLGIFLIAVEDWESARPLLQAGLRASKELRSVLLEAEILEALAELNRRIGNAEEAESHDKCARELYLRLGSPARARRVGAYYLRPERYSKRMRAS